MVLEGDRWAHIAGFYIDDSSWTPQADGGPDQPEAPTSRHATIGDTIVWEVRNSTAMAHPFHLHGFSYQPIAYLMHGEEDHDATEEVDTLRRWDVDWVELEDTTHIPANSSLLFHVEIADPHGDGGAAGRWMKHCHIFQHGESGMMSELVVSE